MGGLHLTGLIHILTHIYTNLFNTYMHNTYICIWAHTPICTRTQTYILYRSKTPIVCSPTPSMSEIQIILLSAGCDHNLWKKEEFSPLLGKEGGHAKIISAVHRRLHVEGSAWFNSMGSAACSAAPAGFDMWKGGVIPSVFSPSNS